MTYLTEKERIIEAFGDLVVEPFHYPKKWVVKGFGFIDPDIAWIMHSIHSSGWMSGNLLISDLMQKNTLNQYYGRDSLFWSHR